MTNKEAAEFIWDVLDGTKSFNEKGGRGLEALDLAIKALKNEKAKESELIKAYAKGFDAGVETVKNERPQGEWITENLDKPYARCSICGEICEIDNFCGNCGADMRKGQINDNK